VNIATYKRAFEEGKTEMEGFILQRASLDVRISKLRGTLLALSAHLDEDTQMETRDLIRRIPSITPRLTDAVKEGIYSAGSRHLPAVQVMILLEILGFDFSSFSNPLASIHTTLRRLESQGVLASEERSGTTLYWWKGPRFGARNRQTTMADREIAAAVNRKIRERVNKKLEEYGHSLVE
jgi:hypothetical protein